MCSSAKRAGRADEKDDIAVRNRSMGEDVHGVSSSMLSSLFNESQSVRAVVRGENWSVWRPSDPLPPPPTAATMCFEGYLRSSSKRNLKADKQFKPQPMCLADANDTVSRRILEKGSWFECAQFRAIWKGMSMDCFDDRCLKSNITQQTEGVILEIGANIGACTIEFLLLTKAKVIAFEPSPTNLFYLTRNIKLALERDPTVADRVVVYPIGAGDAFSQSTLFAERGNLGNTMIGSSNSIGDRLCNSTKEDTIPNIAKDRACGSQLEVAGVATVAPLDAIFPTGFGDVKMVKIDTQGFECKAIRGAQRALAQSARLLAVASESSIGHLRLQCCNSLLLNELLESARPDWDVSCTLMMGYEQTCVGHSREKLGLIASVRRQRIRLNKTLGEHEGDRVGLEYQRKKQAKCIAHGGEDLVEQSNPTLSSHRGSRGRGRGGARGGGARGKRQGRVRPVSMHSGGATSALLQRPVIGRRGSRTTMHRTTTQTERLPAENVSQVAQTAPRMRGLAGDVQKLKEALGLGDGLSIMASLREANVVVGLPNTGPLLEQVDRLFHAIWGEVP